MSWLSGYDKRIKLTIPNTNIDSDLNDFPVTVFFTSTQAEEIFTEFDADSDYMKCAFTSSDGTTQLYAEKELFDDSESKAIYHVKVTSVSSSAGTDIYYYYDNNASDNTTYIGAINTTAGENVWDSNFKAVYHMVDATTSTILDSTSNSNDGTKKAANEPIEAAGKVGQGQDFDGTDDYIKIGTMGNFGSEMATNKPTFEAIVKTNNTTDKISIMGLFNDGLTTGIRITINSDKESNLASGYIQVYLRDEDSATLYGAVQENTGINDNSYHHLVVRIDGPNNNIDVFIDGVEESFTYRSQTTPDNFANFGYDMYIGAINIRGETGQPFEDILDEYHFSNSLRSDAWIKATYNSLWDSLLTYGSEETEEKEGNVLFWFNF